MNKHEILKQTFGYDNFREGQESLIDAIMNGRDVLGIMPTGAGKSICFQIPAIQLEGITLVVSPLISLMKDQVAALNEAGIRAAYINSSLTDGQMRKAMDNIRKGVYTLVYVAPERLLTRQFAALADQIHIPLIAVDEAHCVSQWGQDFRPSYLQVARFIESLKQRPVVAAFTATATTQVREDIEQLLELRSPKVLVTGFNRENLFFKVDRTPQKESALWTMLREKEGMSGIIYCGTRKLVDAIHEKMVKKGYSVAKYHAGLSDGERKATQEAFVYDEIPLIVATNAFGMGIDKSNVRFVIHYNMPKDLESYYQEAGRAGRDGEQAECVLLYAASDVKLQEFMIRQLYNNDLDGETLAQVQERQLEKLKQMTFYCHTNACLRQFILNYFGEKSTSHCGTCGNCLTEFETVDATEYTRNLFELVRATDERYGMTAMVDTLLGAKTARLQALHLHTQPLYGTMKQESKARLRAILNDLLLEEMIAVSSGDYPVLQLTEKSRAFLQNPEAVFITKLPKIQKKTSASKSTGRKSRLAGHADEGLFQKLRAKRKEIADRIHKPPFVVFSDKTLVDMCHKMPVSRSDMLEVHGVGETKFEHYGDVFLRVIQEHGQE